MPELVGIRFHGVGKAYDFDPNGLNIRPGDAVIVETVQGLEMGFAANATHTLPKEKIRNQLKPVIRIATAADLEQYGQNLEREREAFRVCREKISEHRLEMNLVSAEYTFDARKIVFCFTSEGRIDFRNLVKDLAQIFHVRIELRQIGVRDEARMVGGVGICGREFCCSSFLTDFVPVSIKMAKEQSLSMNPAKISGCCGRLMCCLKYEQEAYASARKGLPKLKAIIDTPAGRGKVVSLDTLKERVCVVLEDSPDREIKIFTKADLGIGPAAGQTREIRRRGSEDASGRPDASEAVSANLPDSGAAALPPDVFDPIWIDESVAGSIDLSAVSVASRFDAADIQSKARALQNGRREGAPARQRRKISRPARPGFVPHPIDSSNLSAAGNRSAEGGVQTAGEAGGSESGRRPRPGERRGNRGRRDRRDRRETPRCLKAADGRADGAPRQGFRANGHRPETQK